MGQITSDYYFAGDSSLPHQRKVKWLETYLTSSNVPAGLWAALENNKSLRNLTSKFGRVLHHLLPESLAELDVSSHPSNVPSPSRSNISNTFVFENHLEQFLVANWDQTVFGDKYDLYKSSNTPDGRQFGTDTGPIDILAISKNKKSYLVVELKRERATDNVVGQILRYMDYIKKNVANSEQTVRGVVVANRSSRGLERALSMVDDIDLFYYDLQFKLFESS